MIDTATQKPVRVSGDLASGSYIRLSVDQLDHVRQLMVNNDIPHWVDHHTVSVDNGPAMTVINIGLRVNPNRVQALLDAAP
jgi:hypothetical protein